ncbi:hypothetical protein THTE_2894 [Thermogutta terrifontis]|uniref:Uncharacterized protein n=1 Tax=Thermogutta terrifontis TaxID=1331910 RepID=A0A286RHU5_9BACT|nr:hypothetical protein THTE_2894 [Thermogutta terrifontis]
MGGRGESRPPNLFGGTPSATSFCPLHTPGNKTTPRFAADIETFQTVQKKPEACLLRYMNTLCVFTPIKNDSFAQICSRFALSYCLNSGVGL